MAHKIRILWAFSLIFFIAPALAPSLAEEAAAKKEKNEQASSAHGLPAEVATTHLMTLGDEKLKFIARSGAVRLSDAQTGAPQADVAFVSYERAEADPFTRPVVFVFNGGPGAASAWLGLGALSPWRLRLATYAPSPSTPPLLVDNAETWLAFADLVFVDPPGAGYSKLLGESEDLKKHFFSVQGDAEALAVVVRKWLTTHRRLVSPKYLVGESYGGFRVVKLARALRERENTGVDGLVLISPVLDFSWLEGSRNLLSFAAYLPSFAAISRSAKDRADLGDVEAYAVGQYVSDLVKGVKDPDALSRLSENVARMTGLDHETVARLAGRIDTKTFSRERLRASGRVLSSYDGEVVGFDPAPFSRDSYWADPVLDSLRAPLGAAMTRIITEKLDWPIGDARYEILNDQVAHRWDFERGGRLNAEAVSDLRQALAIDPRLKVLIVHGLTDLVTPYFATKLLLDQLPAYGALTRMKLLLLPGGHMPYLRDDSRRMLRDAARASIEEK
jgi:carboxypeptidase C (cathepsin A)